MIKRFNKYQRIYPVLFIFLVWFFFSFPALVQGLTPFPAKFQNAFFAPWNAYSELYGPVKNQAMPDIIGQIYPWRMFTIETWKSGAVPLWNPYSFSGTPHLANYQSAVFSPLNLGFFVFRFVDWWTYLILLQPLLAGLFTYMYVRSLKLNSISSLISSISFMLCGFIVSWMDYGTLAYAILYLPLALYAIEKLFSTGKNRYSILLSATVPLSFFSGHFQISIYFLLFVCLYVLFKFIQTKNVRLMIRSVLSIALGLCLAAPQLIPSIELYTQSFRSTIFAKTEVIPWEYIPTLLVPDFFGNPVTGNDWFGHYAEWNAYIGLIGLFLACYAIFNRKNKVVLFFVFTTFLSLFLAFQSPLLDLLVYLRIPVLSTSATGRIIVLFSFSLAILAGFGMEKLMDDVQHRRYKRVAVLICVFSIFFIFLWGILFSKTFLPLDKVPIALSNIKLPSIIFAALVLTLVGMALFKRKNLQIILFVLIVIISSLELLRFAHKWQSYDPKERVFAETGISRYYPQISKTDRVFGNLGAEGIMYYGLQGTEGYDAVYIRRYGQFIAALDTGKLTDSFRSVVSFPKNGKHTLLGANLLGVKYIIHKIADGQQVWAFPFWNYDPNTIKLLFDDKHYQVLENGNAFPRAFTVDKVVVEKDPQKILDAMFSKTTNLRNTAVIEEKLSSPLSTGSATITDYKPNKVTIKTKSQSSTFLVLTDVYYPGWQAYVNGHETKIFRTDFAFRGILVPKGENTVEFVYNPASFRFGVMIAIIGLVGVVILAITSNIGGKRKK